MRRSDVLNSLPVARSAFVVEIGAGPTPFKHTKLILDKYPFENSERHGDIKKIAPIIKADAIKIPLADKSCDLLFVSHVLEHIDRPELFLQEAKRCSKWIYLEFPTRARELMYAWSFHKWLIEMENNKLVFYENDIPQIFGDFFHKNYDFLLDIWSEERFQELNNYVYIESDRLEFEFSQLTAFDYALRRSAKGEQKVNYRSLYGASGAGSVSYSRSLLLKTLIWAVLPDRLIKLRRLLMDKINAGRNPKLTKEILSRLICQKCRSNSLMLANGASGPEIVCEGCRKRYLQVGGVFDFDF